MGKIIRAYELQKNDIYIKQNMEYVVVAIMGGKIYYCPTTGKRCAVIKGQYIGAKSNERVELIGKRKKQEMGLQNSKSVHAFDPDGNDLGFYMSFRQAERTLGLRKGFISDTIHKRLNSKYKFKIID